VNGAALGAIIVLAAAFLTIFGSLYLGAVRSQRRGELDEAGVRFEPPASFAEGRLVVLATLVRLLRPIVCDCHSRSGPGCLRTMHDGRGTHLAHRPLQVLHLGQPDVPRRHERAVHRAEFPDLLDGRVLVNLQDAKGHDLPSAESRDPEVLHLGPDPRQERGLGHEHRTVGQAPGAVAVRAAIGGGAPSPTAFRGQDVAAVADEKLRQ